MTTNIPAPIQRAVPYLALAIALAWLLGDACYDLGRQLRAAIDARNDQLARLWVRLWVGPQDQQCTARRQSAHQVDASSSSPPTPEAIATRSSCARIATSISARTSSGVMPTAATGVTVRSLRQQARAAGLPRRLYTSGRKAELIAALAGV